MFEELKLFKAKHGHCNALQRSGKVGRWVNNQRRLYRLHHEGKRSSMSFERIQKLESIGFQWSPRKSRLDYLKWNVMFEELKSFKAKHGHCNVNSSLCKLGRWVIKQRNQYLCLKEGKTSYMTDERIQMLESIGFQWSLRRSENNSAMQPAVFAGSTTDMEPVSALTAYDAHHRGTEASYNDHITNIDGQKNDSRDVSIHEPDVVISSEAEFRPFLLGGGYC
eukprot:CAMPEP_0116032960 /NCGR_PEP_ID=MMETSP0321-20121206/18594_1 /TAXON_ID=163516 /ORGANISM="Leptocylindrus danicus var. danicus, Strain B650" /LENGTH=221 /DNA_ID=CAMNT_0003508723 /DNA_START=63 /DNA_END=728 /DNA_ORIENTATION=+